MQTTSNITYPKFKSPRTTAFAALFFLGLLMSACVRASIVQEDFAYATGNLTGQNGGVGWGGAWATSASGRTQVLGNDALVYTNGGYNITQADAAGVFYCNYNLGYRGGLRSNTPALSGVVWFSALMLASNTPSSVFIGFNGTETTYYNPSTAYSIGLSNTTLYWSEGGSLGLNATSANDLATNAVHLILGCITFHASGNLSELQLWADPPSLTNLSLPVFEATTYNIGSNLFNIEVGGMNPNYTANVYAVVGALRFSDGNGNAAQAYTDVTGAINSSSGPPIVINTNPTSAIVSCGANAQFSVSASGANLQYQWYQNNLPIPSATAATLSLTNVSALSRGLYTATASNSAGSVASLPATLEVTNCNANLVWRGGDLQWNESSPNWGFVGGVPTNSVAFGDGDSVIFDDSCGTANEVVTLVGTLSPASLTFNGSTNTWTVQGTGSIAGPGGFFDNNLNNISWLDVTTNSFEGGTYLSSISYDPAHANPQGIFRIAPGQWPTNLFLDGDEFVFITASGIWPTSFAGTNTRSAITTAGAYTGQTLYLPGNISFAGNLQVHGGTMVLQGSNTFAGGVQVGYFSQYASSPTLVIGSPYAIGFGPGAGNVAINSGILSTYAGVMDLNGYSITINGLATNVGAYAGSYSTGQVINSGSGVNTLTVGAGDATAVWPGAISGQINVVKIGAGTQTLSGSMTYNNTVVSNGILFVLGSISTAQLDVWGGTLAGNGNIASSPNIMVHPAGTLELIPNAISTFSLAQNVTLQGTTILNISKDSGSPQSDQIIGYSSLILGGTLMLNNIGITPLSPGDSFTLFSPSGVSGSFSTLILPANATWNTSQLASQGIVSVVTVLPTVISTIYEDNFSYNTNLNGTWPDTAGALPWTADPSWLGNGTGAIGDSPTSANAFLPFIPQAGYVYTLSATIDCSAPLDTNGDGGSPSFMALGYANGAGTGVAWQGINNPVGWWLIPPDGSTNVEAFFPGPGEQMPGTSTGNTEYGSENYAVVLNARNPVWTLTYQRNGGTVAGPIPIGASNLPITTVGFGGYFPNSNTVQNFTLTVAGPPASAPVVLTQPAGGAYLVGSTAVLSAYAGGFPLTYQWQVNSNNIPGATKAELILANLSTTNSGSYSLLVSNAAGLVSSSNAVVAVATSLPVTNTLTELVTFNTDNVLPIIPVNGSNLMITELASVSPTPAGDSFDSAYMYNGTTGTAFENSTNNPGQDAVGAGYTFTFNTSSHPGGYDISAIVVYSGWQNFSASQQYTVSYRQVGSTNFNLLTNVQVLEYGGSLRVALTNSLGGPIISQASAIEFGVPAVPYAFDLPPPTTYQWPVAGSVYREIEVDGAPSAVIVPQPTLNIARQGSSVLLSWPASAAGYGLVSSPVLGAGASWQPVSGAPTVVNGTNEVTVLIGGTALYFKLLLP